MIIIILRWCALERDDDINYELEANIEENDIETMINVTSNVTSSKKMIINIILSSTLNLLFPSLQVLDQN